MVITCLHPSFNEANQVPGKHCGSLTGPASCFLQAGFVCLLGLPGPPMTRVLSSSITGEGHAPQRLPPSLLPFLQDQRRARGGRPLHEDESGPPVRFRSIAPVKLPVFISSRWPALDPSKRSALMLKSSSCVSYLRPRCTVPDVTALFPNAAVVCQWNV